MTSGGKSTRNMSLGSGCKGIIMKRGGAKRSGEQVTLAAGVANTAFHWLANLAKRKLLELTCHNILNIFCTKKIGYSVICDSK